MPSRDVEISQGTPEDLGAVLALVASYPEAPGWSMATWTELLGGGSGSANLRRRLFRACDSPGGDLAGLAVASQMEDSTELELVLVHPEVRGQGIGSALLRHWLAWATKQGATQAMLEVRASNQNARRIYHRAGFQEQARRPQYYRNPTEDAVLMFLQL